MDGSSTKRVGVGFGHERKGKGDNAEKERDSTHSIRRYQKIRRMRVLEPLPLCEQVFQGRIFEFRAVSGGIMLPIIDFSGIVRSGFPLQDEATNIFWIDFPCLVIHYIPFFGFDSAFFASIESRRQTYHPKNKVNRFSNHSCL